jgi:cyclopropane fatty-acyl-phospholipid synthase-like methyltransferase
MLDRALANHPEFPTRRVALQDLPEETDLTSHFDAVLCVDAMENVGPEDWPPVLAGLGAVLRPDSPAYVTVELPDGPLPTESAEPMLVRGETLDDDAYHFYPEREQVLGWLEAAGFTMTQESFGDGYWHLLVRRVSSTGRRARSGRR